MPTRPAEEINYQKAVREQRLAAEVSAAKRERDFYLRWAPGELSALAACCVVGMPGGMPQAASLSVLFCRFLSLPRCLLPDLLVLPLPPPPAAAWTRQRQSLP